MLADQSRELSKEIHADIERLRTRPWLDSDLFVRAVVDTSFGAVVVIDLASGDVTECNDALLVLLGAEHRSDIVGHSPLTFVKGDAYEAVQAALLQDSPEPYAVVISRLDGETVDVVIRARTVRSPGNAIRVTQLMALESPHICPVFGTCPLVPSPANDHGS